MLRRSLLIAVLVAMVLTLRPGTVNPLRDLIWPIEPGSLTVTMRPDLFDPDLRPSPFYEPPENRFPPHDFEFAGAARRFYALPAKGLMAEDSLPPLVILLHGSERDGRAMLDMWQGIALQGVFLLAPNSADPKNWSLTNDGPDFMTALLQQAGEIQAFDPTRVFIYGHSAGANMALKLGACTDFNAQAIAAHAGAPGSCQVSPDVTRPFLIQTGDVDKSFPLDRVRSSADWIVAAGNPVTLEIIPGHNHWFYDIGPALADDAWQFFQSAVPRCSQGC